MSQICYLPNDFQQLWLIIVRQIDFSGLIPVLRVFNSISSQIKDFNLSAQLLRLCVNVGNVTDDSQVDHDIMQCHLQNYSMGKCE